MSIDLSKISQTDRNLVHHEHVPEWGGMVHLRQLTAGEVLTITTGARTGGALGFDALVTAICEEDGSPVMRTNRKGEPTDNLVDRILSADQSQSDVISRLALIAMKMNGLLKSSREDAAKN